MTDFSQPDDKRSPGSFVTADGLPGLDEDLLREVLGIGRIPNPKINVPVHPVYMHVIKLPEGVAIPGDGFVHQSLNFL
jgi:hypothetical protein